MDIGKIGLKDFWGRCIENFCLKNAENYNLPNSWFSDCKIIKPIHDLIYSLVGKVGIGIILNIPTEIWWAALDGNWVPNIKYDEIILFSDVKTIKPDRKIYEIVQKRLFNISSGEILFVDDKPENLREPDKLAWKTYCFDQLEAQYGSAGILERIKDKIPN